VQLICAFAVAKARGRKLHSKVNYEVARLESSNTFVGGQRRARRGRGGVERGNYCGEDRASSQQGDSSNEDVPEIEDGSDSSDEDSSDDGDSSGEGGCSGRGKGTEQQQHNQLGARNQGEKSCMSKQGDHTAGNQTARNQTATFSAADNERVAKRRVEIEREKRDAKQADSLRKAPPARMDMVAHQKELQDAAEASMNSLFIHEDLKTIGVAAYHRCLGLGMSKGEAARVGAIMEGEATQRLQAQPS